LTVPALVDDPQALTDLVRRIADAAVVAVDTEFVRERTFRPALCLVQLATEDFCTGVDCRAGLDLEPLFEALTTGGRAWVLHSARQDLEVIWNECARLPERLIDTQVAGALIGLQPQLGLQDLLAGLLDVRLGKEHTRADWTVRPLPAAMLDYALDDVRYLLPAWHALDERLAALGRSSWFEEDCRRVLDEPPVTDPATLARRLRGVGEMPLEQRSAALALLAWREGRAAKADRPRRWILTDDALVQIASRLPRDVESLLRVADLPGKLVSRSGGDIVRAVADRASYRETAEEIGRAARPDKGTLAALKDAVRQRADELGIHAEVLATRRDLAAAAVGEPPEALRSGWRAQELELSRSS
jgi:ribonuclease D